MKKLSCLLPLFFIFSVSLFAQIPAGYYSAAVGKTGAALKTQLSSIITAGAVDKGYDFLYTIYKTSDNLPNGKVWDMYSLKSDGTANYYYDHGSDKCGSYSGEGACYNREHTFCDSWLGNASPQRSDAHHLIPTDGYVNNRRSSFPHGKVGSASWTSSNGSKLGNSDKLQAIQKLHEINVKLEENFTPNFDIQEVIEDERKNSWRFGGKTVFGDSKPPEKERLNNGGIQLSLF